MNIDNAENTGAEEIGLGLKKRTWTTPNMKLYGSVTSLTAGGTGLNSETGSMGTPGNPGPCYDGVRNGMNTSRKHCL